MLASTAGVEEPACAAMNSKRGRGNMLTATNHLPHPRPGSVIFSNNTALRVFPSTGCTDKAGRPAKGQYRDPQRRSHVDHRAFAVSTRGSRKIGKPLLTASCACRCPRPSCRPSVNRPSIPANRVRRAVCPICSAVWLRWLAKLPRGLMTASECERVACQRTGRTPDPKHH